MAQLGMYGGGVTGWGHSVQGGGYSNLSGGRRRRKIEGPQCEPMYANVRQARYQRPNHTACGTGVPRMW